MLKQVLKDANKWVGDSKNRREGSKSLRLYEVGCAKKCGDFGLETLKIVRAY